MSIARAAPSTMGTLIATGFMSGGKAVAGRTDARPAEMAAFFEAFVGRDHAARQVEARGEDRGGRPPPRRAGPAGGGAAGAGLADGFRRARQAAAEGLARTRDMVAQHGRVAYYQEQSKGKEDPGAVAGSYLVEGFARTYVYRGMIEAETLVKRYGPFEAVKGVSFRVERGAGRRPARPQRRRQDHAHAHPHRLPLPHLRDGPGRRPRRRLRRRLGVRASIGYLPENAPLYPDMKVGEFLSFIAAARGLEGAERRRRIERAVETCGLAEVFSRESRRLSRGYRQRAGLAQAILHDPPVLVLDEPTSGLDPNQIVEIRALIRGLGREKTVLLSTHIMQEVEALCGRVLIMSAGALIAQGTPQELASGLAAGALLTVSLKGPLEREEAATLAGLPGVSAVVEVRRAGGGRTEVDLAVAGGSDPSEAVYDWALARGCKILGLTRRETPLEELFARLTGGEGQG